MALRSFYLKFKGICCFAVLLSGCLSMQAFAEEYSDEAESYFEDKNDDAFNYELNDDDVEYRTFNYSCYAPPLFYGPECTGKGIGGYEGKFVTYSVDVIGDTMVICEALGCGYKQNDSCEFGWYSIGQVNNGSFRLYWGNNLASAAIRCKGNPTGSSLTWSAQ